MMHVATSVPQIGYNPITPAALSLKSVPCKSSPAWLLERHTIAPGNCQELGLLGTTRGPFDEFGQVGQIDKVAGARAIVTIDAMLHDVAWGSDCTS